MSSKQRIKEQWLNTIDRIRGATGDEYADLAGQLRKLQDEWLSLYGKPLPSGMATIPDEKLAAALEPAPEPTQQEILKEDAVQDEENVRIADELIGRWNKIMDSIAALNEELAGTSEDVISWIGNEKRSRSDIIIDIVKAQQDLDDLKREWKNRIPEVPMPAFMTGDYPPLAPYDPNKDPDAYIVGPTMEEYNEYQAAREPLAKAFIVAHDRIVIIDSSLTALTLGENDQQIQSLLSERGSLVQELAAIVEEYKALKKQYDITETGEDRYPFYLIRRLGPPPDLVVGKLNETITIDRSKRSGGLLDLIPIDVLIAAGVMGGGAFLLANTGKGGFTPEKLRESFTALGYGAIFTAVGITLYVSGKELFVCMKEVNGNFFEAVGMCVGKLVNTLLETTIEVVDAFMGMIINNLGQFIEKLWLAIGKALKKALTAFGNSLSGILGDTPLGGGIGSIAGGGGGGGGLLDGFSWPPSL